MIQKIKSVGRPRVCIDRKTPTGQFGEQLRQLHDASGYTVSQQVDRLNRRIAAMVKARRLPPESRGVSVPTFYRWLQGRSHPDPNTQAVALAQLFKVDFQLALT
jgi:hypothetical protein